MYDKSIERWEERKVLPTCFRGCMVSDVTLVLDQTGDDREIRIDFEVPELLTGTLKSEIEVCERNSFKICDFHPIKEEHEEDYATPFFIRRRSNGHTPRGTLSASVATVR
uniref:Uncharacterized protein n=1 Tax=Timema genevievae TaxID=629358 RepID=A0A7R9PL09_TIMGE|nr:unnamed protein product [Timema genevievae]